MSASTANTPSMVAAMASTNELFDREVFGERNLAAFGEIYTEDARILPPGAPMISGREGIREFWQTAITNLHAKGAKLSTLELMPTGDGAVEIGKATLTLAPPGEAETQLEAKYVVYWRNEDGRWKWHVDIWNMNA